MPSPTLSYLMATRNKLAYLRHTLPRLLSSVGEDEEVVIIDGASTDGTTEYLRDLHAQGKIHQFLSEPDKGEAHAFNKGLLMVRGELVKFLSDDDVFHYPTIQLCKEYVLANPDVDILGTDGGLSSWGMVEPDIITRDGHNFRIWAAKGSPFLFSGLGVMLRRQSLPLLGLFSTGVVGVDHEYARRVCTLPMCMAWCPRLSFVHLRNPASNAVTQFQVHSEESRRLNRLYKCSPTPGPSRPLWHRLSRPVRWALRPIKRMLIPTPPHPLYLVPITEHLIEEAIECRSVWLDKQNESLPCSFLKSVRGPLYAK